MDSVSADAGNGAASSKAANKAVSMAQREMREFNEVFHGDKKLQVTCLLTCLSI